MNEKKNTSSKNIRCKNMMYTQQMDYLPLKTKDDLIKVIEEKLKPQKYGVIVQDKDKNVKEHIHAMLSFENARSVKNVAQILGDSPQYVEKWKGDARNGYAYLIHATDKSRMKHQYDPSEVTANFDYIGMMKQETKAVEKAERFGDAALIKTLLDLLYTGELNKDAVEKRLSGSQFAKAHRQIEEVWAKRLQNLADDWRKEMAAKGASKCVIWMCGAAGTGKTSFAKAHARKKGEPFYLAGSSRDIFQNYAGEHTIILDELRPADLPYQDLLRITDPFGIDSQVMAPSRYTDKAIACDLIIITTPYDPLSFYQQIFGVGGRNQIDNFNQLLRRISVVIWLNNVEICVMKYDERKWGFVPDKSTSKPNPYSAHNRPDPSKDEDDFFNAMFD